MRHEKPEELIAHEKMMKEVFEKGPPRFCHNCLHYTREGKCEKFDMEPPKEFTQMANQCDEWYMEPPF
jgi:hypothetical protein